MAHQTTLVFTVSDTLSSPAATAAERLLDDLVEAHLVEPAGRGVTGPRYRLHELVRLAAREEADDIDHAATTQVRHGWLAPWYGARALTAYQVLDSAPPPCNPGPTVCSLALRDARREGDALAVGFAASQLALSARVDAAHVDYLTLFEEARDAFRVADDLNTDVAGGDLAGVAAMYGRTDLAERLATTAIADARRTGDRWSEGRALITLADLRASRGDRAAAGTYREALAVWRELRMPARVAQVGKALAQFVPVRAGTDRSSTLVLLAITGMEARFGNPAMCSFLGTQVHS